MRGRSVTISAYRTDVLVRALTHSEAGGRSAISAELPQTGLVILYEVMYSTGMETETSRTAGELSAANTMALSDVRVNLRTIVDEVLATGTQFTITRHGRPVAVLLSHDEYESMIETLNILSDDEAMGAIEEAESELGHGDARA